MTFHRHEKPNKGKSDTWLTPKWLLDWLGPFDMDPCPPNGEGGLELEWKGRVWLNPPYSNIAPFMEKMAKHSNGIALVFARTDTRWFQDHVFGKCHSLFFIRGRLKFEDINGNEYKWNAGAPSVLISYTEEDTRVIQWGHGLQLLTAEKCLEGSFVTSDFNW